MMMFKTSKCHLQHVYDTFMSIKNYVSATCKAGFYHLRNINCIRITSVAIQLNTTELIHAFITSRLGFCNSLLYGPPKQTLMRPQHYSDYFELDSIRSTTASAIIQVMKQNFACHSIPDDCIGDNGPQFDSHEYSWFTRDYGFNLVKSSP